jgi:hypothetical protein
MMAGGETIIKIYTGAPYMFIGFPTDILKEAGDILEDTKIYIQDCIAKL